MLRGDVDIICIDPENEYANLFRAMNGEVIKNIRREQKPYQCDGLEPGIRRRRKPDYFEKRVCTFTH